MQAQEYQKHFALDESQWWFVAKKRFLVTLLRQFVLPQLSPYIVDLGSGTGGVTTSFAQFGKVIGVERSSIAVAFARQRNLKILEASATDTGLPSSLAACVTCIDVLYHRDCDPVATLHEAWRVLRPGGVLIVSDSAVPWLYGPHDVVMHGRERFSESSLRDVAEQIGFQVQYSSYYFCSTFPFFLVNRVLQRLTGKYSDIQDSWPLLDRLFAYLAAAEQRFLARTLPLTQLPIGSSVVVVAQKPVFARKTSSVFAPDQNKTQVVARRHAPLLSIVLPTYNEASAITTTIQRIAAVLPENTFEVLIVDDQSTDSTVDRVTELMKLYPEVSLIQRSSLQRDLGASILEGVQAARGKLLLGMDADGNHRPEDIPKLLRALSEQLRHTPNEPTAIVGSRFLRKTHASTVFALPDSATGRDWVSFLFSAVLRMVCGFSTTDTTSGFYLVPTAVLRQLPVKQLYFGYGEYHLRLLAAWAAHGWSVLEVPIRYGSRTGGRSKSRLLEMAFRYFQVAWSLRGSFESARKNPEKLLK